MTRRAIYVSSVVERAIYRVAGAAPAVLLRLTPDLGSPMAIAIDARRRTLWAGLDPNAPGASATGKGGLLRLALDARTA